MRPAIVFSTLEDLGENRSIVQAAHSIGALVHVYDTRSLSDFTIPSVGTAGPIRLAVSTAGRSPAMAALLRRRIERSIRPMDVARVRLMGRLRRPIQATIRSPEARRDVIYRLLRHREIGRLLRAGRSDEALAVARRVIASHARGSTPVARKAKR
jgi:siroheme synthase-like protein